MSGFAPACVKVGDDRYLAIILQQHGRAFFSGDPWISAAAAIDFAERALADDSFREWHSHAFVLEAD